MSKLVVVMFPDAAMIQEAIGGSADLTNEGADAEFAEEISRQQCYRERDFGGHPRRVSDRTGNTRSSDLCSSASISCPLAPASRPE